MSKLTLGYAPVYGGGNKLSVSSYQEYRDFVDRVEGDGGVVGNHILTQVYLQNLKEQELLSSVVFAGLPAYKVTGTLIDKWYDVNSNDGVGTTTSRPELVDFTPDFDGANDNILIPHNSNQWLTGGGTLSFWVKVNTSGGSNLGRLFFKSSSYQASFQSNGGLQLQIMDGSFVSTGAGAVSYPMLGWVRFDAVFNGSGVVTWYRNAVQIGTPTLSKSPATMSSTGNIVVGNITSLDRGMDGGMALLTIFNSQLTVSQILSNYNATRGYFS